MLFLSLAPGVGGGERAVLPALAGLDEIDLVVAGPEPVCRYAASLGARAIPLEFPHAYRLVGLPTAALRSRRIVQLARQEQAQILYANGTRAMSYATIARVLGGPPLIAHHHGIFSWGPWRSLVFGLKRWADAIVVPSRVAGSPFRSSRKLHVIPNGVDLSHFGPPRDRRSVREQFGLPSEGAVVGMVGRATPGRGMAPFVGLARLLAPMMPDVSFLLAGGAAFPDERMDYEHLERQAAEVGQRMVLTGYLNDPLSAYQAMDVFVHLADPEGFGLSVVEAMSCGLPVVAYDWGGVAEIVDKASTGLLVEPGNLEAAAEAVKYLLVDEETRRSMGSRARAVCEERYGVERFSGQISSVIAAVASR